MRSAGTCARRDTPRQMRCLLRHAWILGIGPSLACETVVAEVDIRMLVPADDTILQGADNAHISLQPSGFSESFAVDGLDFELEVVLDPDDTARTLALYLARGETLLGYGSTPPFEYDAAASIDMRVLLAYPGLLGTFPYAFDVPDPGTTAATFGGVGLLALGTDGTSLFLDGYTYALRAAAPWPAEIPLPPPHDGTFLSEGHAIVTRVWWSEILGMQRFDLREDAWTAVPVEGDAANARAGASFVHDETQKVLWVFGGGARRDIARVDLADPETARTTVEPAWLLDAPRAFAHAIAVGPPEAPEFLLAGGDDPSLPRIFLPARAEATGPTGDWQGLRCASLDAGRLRVVCGGGVRDGAPTPDALLIELQPGQPTMVSLLSGLLTLPMPDLRWLSDDFALYAQSGSTLVRIDRATLGATPQAVAPTRETGGSTVELATGITLIIGGALSDGQPANRWSMFAPTLSSG